MVLEPCLNGKKESYIEHHTDDRSGNSLVFDFAHKYAYTRSFFTFFLKGKRMHSWGSNTVHELKWI
jgi:hypothetical protein